MYYFGSLTKKFKTPGFRGKYFNFPGNSGAQKPRENGIPGGNRSHLSSLHFEAINLLSSDNRSLFRISVYIPNSSHSSLLLVLLFY